MNATARLAAAAGPETAQLEARRLELKGRRRPTKVFVMGPEGA